MREMEWYQSGRTVCMQWVAALVFCFVVSVPLCAEASMREVTKTKSFALLFDANSGAVTIHREQGQPFLNGVVGAIHTKQGTRVIAAPDFTFGGAKVLSVNDAIGVGKQVTIAATGGNKELNATLKITLYDQPQGVVFEVIGENCSATDLHVKSIEPLRVLKEEGGALIFADARQCLLNGAMYYDAGVIHTFGEPYEKERAFGEMKGVKESNQLLTANDYTVQSWWNMALFRGYNREAISIGYIQNSASIGRIQLLKTDPDRFSFVVESVYGEDVVLKRGQSISSDKVMISLAADPYTCLENYAEVSGKVNGARTGEVVNGWCNWFYTLDYYSEQEVLRNARYAAEHLKPYGLEYIQIDEGYQQRHGEWDGGERFPHGMRWLAQEIKKLGLKPGIWISPFVVSEDAAIFKEHPDWFLKNRDGSHKRVGPWMGEQSEWFKTEKPKRYALDITHPGAEKWFTDLVDTLANGWGYELIKVDFVAWTVFAAHQFYDPSATMAQVYTKAFEIMHRVAGEDCQILDCGPGQLTLGSSSSMRIEQDQNYGFIGDKVWTQYFSGPCSSAAALGKRYYFHNALWTNDIDHVCVDMLTLDMSRAVATLIGLSGGNTITGDRLVTLDNTKLEVLKKVFPATDAYVRPIDLLENDPQTAFVTTIQRPFAEWTVAGIFNPTLTESSTRSFPLERLRLDAEKTYLVYDFWKERLLGEITDTLQVELLPGSVSLLSLHEKRDVPQVISTTRHIMQGAIELENVYFDVATSVLSGRSVGAPGTRHSVIVYLPAGYDWSNEWGKLYDDYGLYSVKRISDNLVRIDLQFDALGLINWQVKFSAKAK